MNAFWVSCILSVVSNFGIALFVWVKSRRNLVNKIFSRITISVGLWSLGGSVFSLVPESQYNLALFWWQFSYIGAIFVPIFYTHFIFEFFNLKRRKLIVFIYSIGIIFLLLNWLPQTRLLLCDLRFVFNQFYWNDWMKNKSLLWIVFYVGLYWVLLSYAFFILIIQYRKAKGFRRNQLRYVIFSSVVGWVGAESIFLLPFHINFYPYPNFLIAIYPLILAYAIIKYRLMDIRVAITRAGIFLVLYTVVLGIPFYVGYHTESWVTSTSFAVVLATIGPLVYRSIQKKAEDLLLAKQRHYQQILLQAAGGMVREHNLDRLLKLIVYIVKKAVKIKFAAIFSHNKEKKTYVLKAVRDHKAVVPNLIISDDSPLISHMKQKALPFAYEEMPQDLRKDLEERMGTTFALIVPSVIKDEVLGFLVLGEKLDKSHYSQDDINVFQILSHQASLAIENCLFFEEFKKVQHELFQAEKLASIGGMADGVAHQIKNRLNHFSLASGELKLAIKDFITKNPQLADDEKIRKLLSYLSELADSIISNVKRTDGIVRGILNFARTTEKESFLSYFSLQKIIDSALGYLLIKHEVGQIPLEINLNSVDTIWGIESQFNEVIFNLLDNAYEATQQLREVLPSKDRQAYQPKITVEAKEDFDSYIIIISDNGIGIKEEDKPKICSPFFTTKSSYKSGSGIGMYVARRIIEENHNGKLWFESEYFKGTKFYIKLPKQRKP